MTDETTFHTHQCEEDRHTIEMVVEWIAQELRMDPCDIDGDGDEGSILIGFLDQIRNGRFR